jgi:hypothetical protein
MLKRCWERNINFIFVASNDSHQIVAADQVMIWFVLSCDGNIALIYGFSSNYLIIFTSLLAKTYELVFKDEYIYQDAVPDISLKAWPKVILLKRDLSLVDIRDYRRCGNENKWLIS